MKRKHRSINICRDGLSEQNGIGRMERVCGLVKTGPLTKRECIGSEASHEGIPSGISN